GILLAICVVTYANDVSAPLIYDDFGVVRDNPTIRRLWPPGQPLSPPSTGNPMSGRPVVNLMMAVNYAIGGVAPRGYHVVNIAIHAGCALLMFGLVRRTLDPLVGQ